MLFRKKRWNWPIHLLSIFSIFFGYYSSLIFEWLISSLCKIPLISTTAIKRNNKLWGDQKPYAIIIFRTVSHIKPRYQITLRNIESRITCYTYALHDLHDDSGSLMDLASDTIGSILWCLHWWIRNQHRCRVRLCQRCWLWLNQSYFGSPLKTDRVLWVWRCNS